MFTPLLVAALSYPSAPVQAQELPSSVAQRQQGGDPPRGEQRGSLDERVGRLERIVEGGTLLRMQARIDELSREIREMRGEMQVLQHNIDQGNQSQRTLYQNLDQRLRRLESTAQGVAPSSPGAGVPTPQSAQPPAAPGAVPPSTPQAGPGQGVPPSAGRPSAAAAPGEQGAADYQKAFDLLRQGRYDQAVKAFRAFLAAHPKSRLDGNAQYWLAEIYYVKGNSKAALTEFHKVVNQYPDSPKAPDAMLKIGYVQSALGERAKARATFRQVVSRYPNTTAARLAQNRLRQK
ncbi:MAG: tol-pal system protein YbgF [Gammaproteobacteria bacterium]|nr:tol-pal system protein YbgF [Gammaproteobacteria bacterium]